MKELSTGGKNSASYDKYYNSQTLHKQESKKLVFYLQFIDTKISLFNIDEHAQLYHATWRPSQPVYFEN